jgi:hypothetical protein
MKHNRKWMACTAQLCIVLAGLALGADGQKVKVEGLITSRDGDSLTLKSSKAGNVVVTLTDDTKVQTPKGIFRHTEKSVTALIPGLQVKVEGTGSENQVTAKTVTFDNDDLVLAETIQAGLNPTNRASRLMLLGLPPTSNKALPMLPALLPINRLFRRINRTLRPRTNASMSSLNMTPRPPQLSISQAEARRFPTATKLL